MSLDESKATIAAHNNKNKMKKGDHRHIDDRFIHTQIKRTPK
jgi:hypothetical protein